MEHIGEEIVWKPFFSQMDPKIPLLYVGTRGLSFEGSCSGFNWHQVYLVFNVEYRIKTPKIMLFVNFPSGAGQKR